MAEVNTSDGRHDTSDASCIVEGDQVKRTDQSTGQYKINPNTKYVLIYYAINAGPFFSLDWINTIYMHKYNMQRQYGTGKS